MHLMLKIQQNTHLNMKKMNKLCDIIMNIIRIGLFSKYFSNIYLEFFKNLPNSFSNRSNYQVTILFTTLQHSNNIENDKFQSICKFIHLILKEIFHVVVNCDYKLKVQIIQFIVDLIWSNCNLNTASYVFEALSNIFQLINDLSIYNLINDTNNEKIMSNWLNLFIEKTLEFSDNVFYAAFLINVLKFHHLILDAYLDKILIRLKVSVS